MGTEVSWEQSDTGEVVPKIEGVSTPTAWAPQPGSQCVFLQSPVFEVLLSGNRGGGKDLALSTLVLTDSGWKCAGDVDAIDRLVAPDGSYVGILGIFPKGPRPFYRLTLTDGVTVDACAEHRWKVIDQKTGYWRGWKVRTTEEIAGLRSRQAIPYIDAPLPGRPWDGPDPYMIGQMIGNGTTRGARLTLYTIEHETLDYAETIGWNTYRKPYAEGNPTLRAVCPERAAGAWRAVLPHAKARNKYVPQELLDACPQVRLALLQGLMDSDGSVDKGGRCEFTSVSYQLALDVQYLAHSLGARASCRWQEKQSNFGSNGYWRTKINPRGVFIPFRLPRKAARVNAAPTRSKYRTIRSIERIGDQPGVCFAVDHPSHCFVVQHAIVTHNTDVLIMDFLQHVGQGFGEAWRGLLLRQSVPRLEDVIKKTKKWIPRVFPSACYNKSTREWTFADGETLRLTYADTPDDYENYHGHEYPWIGFEELTTWASSEAYKLFMSLCRSTIKSMPAKFRATTNPYGVGHNWVKTRFRLPVPPGKIVGPIFGPEGNRRCAVRSDLRENKILLDAEPDYMARIGEAARNESERLAWVEGDWDIVAGGMFDDVWSPPHHVVPDLTADQIPEGWRLRRSYDHGQSAPFSVGWWAESNGEPIEVEGVVVGRVRGDRIRIYEWYGWRDGSPNEGLRMLAREIGEGIRERQRRWGIDHRTREGPADSSIFDDFEPGRSVAGEMELEGIYWDKADKGRGSRKQGWEVFRTFLKNAIPGPEGVREYPGLFVCRRCAQFLRTVPVAPRSSDDLDEVDDKYEDHVLDDARYYLRSRDTQLFEGTC